MKLTEKQKRFADYYIESANATEAAKKAGYKQPHVQGSQNLEKLSVRNYIEERNKQLEDIRIADMKEVKEFWSNTMRNIQNELKDRLKASEYIAKTNAAFIEKREVSGETTHNINTDLSKLSVEELKQIESILSKAD